MNKIRLFLISFLVIVSMSLIRISYNGAPSDSLFSILLSVFYKLFSQEKLYWDYQIINLNYSFIEFLLTSIYLLAVSILNKKILTSIGLFLFIALWGFWLCIYSSYIEVGLYLKTSIPFLLVIIIGLIVIYKIK